MKVNNQQDNIKIALSIFEAIEHRGVDDRDAEILSRLFQPDVEFVWPPSLPYGGTFRGLDQAQPSWAETWNPLQPGPAERRMDPRVIASNDQNEVVVVYRQRGVSPAGERIDTEVMALYEVRDGKLARAQMFHFEETATAAFLAIAAQQLKGESGMNVG